VEYYLRRELAKAAGLNFETLRYYEKINLIQTAERNKSGYRLYPKDMLMGIKENLKEHNCSYFTSLLK